MKPRLLLLTGLFAVATLVPPAPAAVTGDEKPAGTKETVADLATGTPAPAFNLPGIDGKTYTLDHFSTAKILVVAFISNHCPDSQASEGRLKKFVADFQDKGVALVAINPNNPVSVRLDELGYSKYNDSFDEMKLHAKEQDFNFPYLYDGETQATSRAYGCLATPHVFIFDESRKLRYKGAFDDSPYADPATVNFTGAQNAVRELLAGKPVSVETTKIHGCSTKWLSKQSQVAAVKNPAAGKPVEVATIDPAGVAALRKNGTGKYRLFNVWATWCISCVEEFPELITTAQKFSTRNFELITLSLDQPSDLAKVKTFLETEGAAIPPKLVPTLKAEGRTTNSYIYTGGSHEDLIKALDPEWPGPTPHTVLVAPNGEIVWRHNGEVNGDELRSKVLEHLGRYYQPE
jgi:peroxiredoxin